LRWIPRFPFGICISSLLLIFSFHLIASFRGKVDVFTGGNICLLCNEVPLVQRLESSDILIIGAQIAKFTALIMRDSGTFFAFSHKGMKQLFAIAAVVSVSFMGVGISECGMWCC
jgi:hypothetical protein